VCCSLFHLTYFIIVSYLVYVKHELCVEFLMHYISFTFKQSLTALLNACTSAFNLFLCLLFTSTYSHRWRRTLCLRGFVSFLLLACEGARTHTKQASNKKETKPRKQSVVLFLSCCTYYFIVPNCINITITFTLLSFVCVLNMSLLLKTQCIT